LENDRTNRGEKVVGRIVVSEFVSIDGVMEDPGGAEGTKNAGWTFKFNRGPEGDRYKLDEALAASGLLLGRRTYEGFAAAWPSMEGEFADQFNSMPKYVVSSTLELPSWNNTTVLSGPPAESVARLRDEVDGELLVNGSARLVSDLVAHGLVDELRLMVFPVVLGEGKTLFETVDQAQRFELAGTTTVGEGVLILTFTLSG
jgi:dihydrofolate reductase